MCAVDPQPQPDAVGAASALVDHQARQLSTLAAELRADEALRRSETAEAQALTDPLTGLMTGAAGSCCSSGRSSAASATGRSRASSWSTWTG